MGSEFPTIPLGQLCDPDRGITYGIVKVGEFVPEGIPIIRGGDIRNGRIEIDHAKRVSQEVSEQFRRTVLKGGEIVMNLIAEAGHAAIVPRDFAGFNVSRDVAVIPLNDAVNHRFVEHVLKSPQHISWLASRLQGSVTQKINLSTLRESPIPIPPRQIQDWIADVLGALDAKIELNRRMNQTLQEMAHAVFRSWFVNFDPIRAKAEGCQPLGMDAATAALFPDSFQDSQLGKIPKGWQVRSLDAVAHFLNGLALQKYPPNGNDCLPVIKIAQLHKGGTVGADQAAADLPPDYVVHDGDVLFSWSGSLEVVIWCGGRGALNQHLFKVTSPDYPKWFYYFWIREHLPEFQAIASGKATTMGHIQRHHLSEAKVLVPPTELVSAMDKVFSPTVEAMVGNNLQCRSLAAIRDALLPKLISGEIRVKDVVHIATESGS